MAFLTGALLALPILAAQAAAKPKHRRVFLKRLGLFRYDAFKGFTRRPIWIHALSVGEVLSSVPLAKAVKSRYPERPLVFSTSTAGGYDTAARALGADVDGLFFFPYDLILSVKRAFKHIRPIFVVLVETDIWPNFLWEAERLAVPVFLVNARVSDRSFKRMGKIKGLIGPVLSVFEAIFSQSAIDAGRYRKLGVPPEKILVSGNLKFDPPPSASSPPTAILQWIRHHREDEGHFIWVAGSTHEGEEAVLAQTLQLLGEKKIPMALLVAPRDPTRAEVVGRIFRTAGFTVQKLSQLDGNRTAPALPAQVLIIDAIGFLKELYRLADITFVGGSLVPFGGHNPLEPAAFGKPILFGPHMGSFRDIATSLVRKKGALVTATSIETATEIAGLLVTHPHRARLMGQRAFRFFSENQGAVHRTLSGITERINDIRSKGGVCPK